LSRSIWECASRYKGGPLSIQQCDALTRAVLERRNILIGGGTGTGKTTFSADQRYVDLLEQARDLLAHQIPDRDLPQVQRLAIEALLEKLQRRKYGATKKRCATPPDAAVAAGASNPMIELAEAGVPVGPILPRPQWARGRRRLRSRVHAAQETTRAALSGVSRE
jgi:hypothetical protein